MQKIYIIILFFIFSCSYKKESVGSFNEIVVISSPEDKSYIYPILDRLFSSFVYTPQEEKKFDLIYKDPSFINEIKYHSNILFTSLTFPEDSTGDLLVNRFINNFNNENNIFGFNDLYANNQNIIVIKSTDIIEYESIIKQNKKWLVDQYDLLLEKKIVDKLYVNGKNKELSKIIYENIKIPFDLQIDYKLIKNDTLNSFTWVGRGYPYRWITFYKTYKNKNVNTWDYINNTFDKVMPDISISNYFRINDVIKIDSLVFPLYRGLYEHSESDTGGPFFVIIFESKYNNKVILISGFVNYPGHKKILLLRELEIIIKENIKGELNEWESSSINW